MTIGGAGAWLMQRCSGRHMLLLVLALMVAATTVKTFQVARKPATGIEIESLLVASDIVRGMRGEAAREGGQHTRPPALPLVLAALAQTDNRLMLGLTCRDRFDAACAKANFTSVIVVQLLLAFGVLGMGLVLAWRLSGSYTVGVMTLVLLFAATRPGDFAGILAWNAWHQALLMAGALATLFAHQRASLAFSTLGGAAFGAGALLEPQVAVMVPVAAVALALCTRTPRRWGLGIAALIGGCAAFGLLLWLAVRLNYNPEGFGRYLVFRLAERLEFDRLDLRTHLIGILLPVPLLGNLLQSVLLSSADVQKFGMYWPGSMAHDALFFTTPRLLGEGGSATGGVMLIMRTWLTGEPLAYLAALPAALSRGLWANAGLVGLFGMLHLSTLKRYARAEGTAGALAVVMLPILALLIVNALTTGNHYFLNPMLPFLFSYAIAYVAAGW